ncbi:Chlorite dismutase [Nitrospira japonica]|uniref:Chlorite dismutase n=1 Tax=Nitrospira japonica TaxID=1325564 RepID=A0A1W1I6H9_9BACT|nr:chlorite dismutase family protein [Nitrospira japonica]SLM48616.1 Chlorite dismutase [Nitrospira japonica]
MSRSRCAGLYAIVLCVLLGGWVSASYAAADRDKLLSEPGIYGTFAAFGLTEEWGRLDAPAKIAHLTALKGVVEQHREKVAIDLYLLRGLSDHADVLFRIHAADLRDSQKFLVDLHASPMGRYLKGAGVLNGMSKKANYVPGFPDQMKADLKTASEPGPVPYAIVIPIRKSAEWWALDQEKRAVMMKEHTEAALPYHKTVKRKLYHSSGLDDLDFITYFETSNLEDFHNLILSLEKVKEFQYTRRFGHPTLLGTSKSLDQLIETLAQ